jgi:hypothetical protein
MTIHVTVIFRCFLCNPIDSILCWTTKKQWQRKPIKWITKDVKCLFVVKIPRTTECKGSVMSLFSWRRAITSFGEYGRLLDEIQYVPMQTIIIWYFHLHMHVCAWVHVYFNMVPPLTYISQNNFVNEKYFLGYSDFSKITRYGRV